MKNNDKTSEQLFTELKKSNKRIVELEKIKTEGMNCWNNLAKRRNSRCDENKINNFMKLI